MNNEDKKIVEYNDKLMKKILKSVLFTFYILLFTIFIVFFISDLIFHDENFSIIISFCISIIFTIFYCTITIIDEIKKNK